jgi:hypothetical protein
VSELTNNRAYRIFTGLMTVIGIYAVIRHGGQWAYELGKFVGSN